MSLPGYDIVPFATLYGGRVSLGDITGSLRWDLVAGPGRDPAAPASVQAFSYDGSALVSPPGVPSVAFPGGYGVNPVASALGW